MESITAIYRLGDGEQRFLVTRRAEPMVSRLASPGALSVLGCVFVQLIQLAIGKFVFYIYCAYLKLRILASESCCGTSLRDVQRGMEMGALSLRARAGSRE